MIAHIFNLQPDDRQRTIHEVHDLLFKPQTDAAVAGVCPDSNFINEALQVIVGIVNINARIRRGFRCIIAQNLRLPIIDHALLPVNQRRSY